MTNPSHTIANNLRIQRLIWGSFIISMGIFGVVLAVTPVDGEVDPTILYALSGVALMEIPMVFVMRYVQVGRSLGLIPADDLREDRVADDVEEDLKTAIMKYQTATLVGLALAESIGLMGFVASFLSGQFIWYAVWASVAWLLMFVQVPRREGILAVMEGPARRRVRQLLGE